MIQVVAGILCNLQGEVLIALRPAHVIQGNLWEFPGGKIEAEETAYQALVRELKEEIGIDVTAARPYMSLQHAYPERVVMLDVWWVETYLGVPHGHEGQAIQWVKPAVIATLPFPAGNKPIIDKLLQEK